MKIAVLVSGGVDSSVALNVLKDQGHDLTVFYLKIWLEDELSSLGQCPWQEDLFYVKEVCKRADVSLEVISLQREYWDHVVSYTINEIKSGRTPNPDIFCNKLIKFGFFFDTISKDFDKVATGHYAQIIKRDGVFHLICAPDEVKDQTYFLSYLDQSQLARTIFPIGHLSKDQVRQLACTYDLPNKDRKDSQGICFLGKLKFDEFIKYHLGDAPGDIVEVETGKKLGQHKGFWFHTIGQRRGSGLPGGPWYVVSKDTAKNIVYISKDYYSEDKLRDTFEVSKMNWISDTVPSNTDLQVKVRHGKKRYNAKVEFIDNSSVKVKLACRDQGIAPGQFAVFYDSDTCLGGGVITKSL